VIEALFTVVKYIAGLLAMVGVVAFACALVAFALGFRLGYAWRSREIEETEEENSA
jgi:hypothetical protein